MVCACAVGTTNLHTGTHGIALSLFSVCHNYMLLEHQAYAVRILILPAVGPPFMPDPNRVGEYASLIPRP